ncbi:MAG: EAL domain-containing protein [Scytonema sp. PMC 1069.18]|nr:EAL domain-containing protein [Scytonema sp. PMC 1069.18]
MQISAAVGLTSWLSLKNGEKAINDVSSQLRSELTARILQQVTTYMADPQHIVEETADYVQLGLINIEDSTSLERYLWYQMQSHNGFFITAVGSEIGNVSAVGTENDGSLVIKAYDGTKAIARGSRNQGKLYTYTIRDRGLRGNLIKSEEFHLKNRPWYKAAVKARKPTWTDIYPNYTLPILIISAVRPIYDPHTHHLIGVTSATLSLRQMSDFLQTLKIGHSGQTYIIERSGNLVATSTGEKLHNIIYKEKRERRKATDSNNSLVKESARYLTKHFGSFSNIRQVEQLEFVLDGKRQFLQVTPFSDGLGLDWLIVIVVPESDFVEQIQANTQLTIYLCIGALIFAIYSSILTARWITLPLSQLHQAAKEVAQGNLQQTLTVAHIKEIEELAHSFNQMVVQLQSSFTQLHSLNQAVSNNESRLAQLLEALPVGVTMHDTSGQLLYINQIGKSFFGIEKILKATTPQLAETYHLYRASTQKLYPTEELPIVRALAGEIVQTDDLEIRQEDRVVPLEIWATPVFDDSSNVVCAIAAFQDISYRQQAEEQLLYNALHDALTGLPNRNLLMERLELTINRAKRHGKYHFAVLFLDLDRFKIINDSLGHSAGDELLMTIARKLQSIIRATDLAARLGGDEFIILLDNIEGIQEAVQITERIFAELRYPMILAGREVVVTVSIGIVLGTKNYKQASDLLRDADTAMYQAKAKGKDQYAIFNVQMHTQALERLHLENDLRKALENQEFLVYYQPIISLETKQIAGFEALVRWRHPSRGLVAPTEFITVAEETGLIVALDCWVLQEACRQFAEWQTKFPHIPFLKVSVNLSVQDLRKPNLVEYICCTLAQTGLDSQYLTLEITESMLIDNVADTIDLLLQLKKRGLRISIDDFGTGYSSLSYLHRLPVDTLKIDRAFVSQVQESSRNHTIAETIVALSNQLGIAAIAEGIETQQQFEWLQHLGCEFGQGLWFFSALSPEELELLL